MMNIEDKDKDSELGTSSRIRTKLLRTSSSVGAGVNAGSKLNRAFASCDPLSELVWSPRKGLGLKCANFQADDSRKPVLLWNVGLKPVVDQGNLILSQTLLDPNDIIIDKAMLLTASGDCQLGPSDGDGLETDRGMEEADKNDAIVLEQNVVTAESRDELAAPSKKLESSAEKGECSLVGAELLMKDTLPVESSCMSSKVCSYREKEKGKALSDGDIYGRSSDDEDDNHASTESSNSRLSGIGKKGRKRQAVDEDALSVSKRMKTEIFGSHGSNTKPNSSFMKWISNMTRGGISGLNLEDSLSPLPLACSNEVLSKSYQENFMCFRTQTLANVNTGFQTMFQSMYDKRFVEPIEEESRENEVDGEKSPENPPESHDRTYGNSSGQTTPCSKEDDHFLAKNRAIRVEPLDEETKETSKEAYPDIPLATSEARERSNPNTSLWITRFSTKTYRSEKGKEIVEEADLDSNAYVEAREESADLKSLDEICPVLPSRIFSLEAMASDFARRLDALKHIMSSKKATHSIYSACIFCGGGHDVLECSSITRSELEDLLLKSGAFDSRVKESPCLCIRCLKPDHWAVSCPDARRLKICGGEDQSCEPRDGSTVKNEAMKSEIFDAIRSLRLTRADILRWMDSKIPSSRLNGFFLRLRLGSIEAGLGESGYCVAVITGDVVRGNDDFTTKKFISVDVGGIKSSVASQYVSNQDFLEDEIKTWWCRTVGSGCRLPSLAELNSKFNDRQNLGL